MKRCQSTKKSRIFPASLALRVPRTLALGRREKRRPHTTRHSHAKELARNYRALLKAILHA